MRTVGIYTLRILGMLCALYSMVLLISGKGADMVPLWFLMGVLLACLSIRKLFDNVFRRRWVKSLLAALILLVVLCEGVIFAFGHGKAPEAVSEYVIVLGAKVNGTEPSPTLRYRLDKAYEYLAAHESTKAVLSGGQGSDESISEAEAMRLYLVAKGINDHRLILEDKSTSTYENLNNSFKLIGGDQRDNITVITSRFHVLRVKIIAAQMGRQIGGIGTKIDLLLVPNYYVRELFAILNELI